MNGYRSIMHSMRLQETRFYGVNGNKCVTALGDISVIDRRSDLNNTFLSRSRQTMQFFESIRFLFGSTETKNTRANVNSEIFLLRMYYIGPATMNSSVSLAFN